MGYLELSNPLVRDIVLNKYKKRCAYCGCKLDVVNFVVDHILAKKDSGPNVIDNFNPACRPCNTSKMQFTIEEWRYIIADKLRYLNEKNTGYITAKRLGLIKEVTGVFMFHFEKIQR